MHFYKKDARRPAVLFLSQGVENYKKYSKNDYPTGVKGTFTKKMRAAL
jgi:hypothetical protein